METALATIDAAASYPVLFGDTNVTAALRENLAGERLSWSDLQRVSVPTGGGQFWTVNGEPVKTIEGIMVATHNARSYWAGGIEDGGGGAPPDCSSVDAITGIGNPGGDCLSCPLAAFGSAIKGGKEGRGQACKQSRQIYLLCEGSALPMLLIVPATSLKPVKQYLFDLANKGLMFSQVVSRFALAPEKNQDGIGYSVIKPSIAGQLTAEQSSAVREYIGKVMKTIAAA